ncbi:MAG TPA: sigma 54-interacting transcriptional regulator [Polyangiaceae bacterium]
MVRARSLVEAASLDTCPVLLAGETGTGKGYQAERIHALSSRARAPFVHVFAAHLSPESFAPGGSASAKKIFAARGGTLFIDEVEELAPPAQVRLFHFVEAQSRASAIDVHVLVATRRDPEQLAASPDFRRDLFFRLAALTIALPPLRARKAEIPSLARAFIAEAAVRVGRPAPLLASDAETALASYAWPGNVRQLRSVVAAATIAAETGVIRRDCLWLPTAPPTELEPRRESPCLAAPPEVPVEVSGPRKPSSGVRALDRSLIAEALARMGGNQGEAARFLGVSRRTLINRIEEFYLPRPRKRGSK